MKTGFKVTAAAMALTLASLIVLPACSGCNSNDITESTSVSIESTNLSGVYTTDAVVDLASITMTIKVSYADGTSKSLSNFAYSEEYTASSSVDFILYTGGFYNQVKNKAGTSAGMDQGNYAVTCKLLSDGETYDLGMSVLVTNDIAGNFSLMQTQGPSLYTTYQQNLARVDEEGADSSENNFYKNPEYYEVGDDNPFVFSPSLILLKNGASATDAGSMVTLYDPEVTSSVSYNNQTLADGNDYVTINGSSFQFKSDAIGKVFTITVTPTLYSTATTYSMTVKVEDGYNVYDAKDLGRISLVDNPDTFNYGDYELGKAGAKAWYVSSSSNSITLTDEVNIGKLWYDFLKDNGATDTDLKPVHGIFIHSDITVTQSDIPSAYFIGEEEAQAAARIYQADYDSIVGTIRDWGLIYIHYMDSNENFIFNGNLFNIDLSQISLATTCTDYENFYYPANYTGMYYGGSEVAFTFNGKALDKRTSGEGVGSVTFENVESIGNTAGLRTDTEGKVIGSLQFLRASTTHIDVDNCIIKDQRIAFYSEYTDSTYEGFTISDTKVYDCYNCVITAYLSAKNSATHSEFKRFGGPISILTCRNGLKVGYCSSGFTMDSTTVAENLMTGDEAWFTLRGIDVAIAPIKAMDVYFEACGKTYLQENGTEFNLYTAMTDIGYVTPDDGYDGNLYCDFCYGNTTALHMDDSTDLNATDTDAYNAAILNEFIATELKYSETITNYIGSMLPIFMTNTGTMFFPFIKSITNTSTIVLRKLTSANCSSVTDLRQAPTATAEDFAGANIIYFVYPYESAIIGVALGLYDYNATT
ncbi:MAG: hypothetical protein LUE27_11330 [Clostridia bacterium]|nr:hypothetical protein [Clostridia bacterium]